MADNLSKIILEEVRALRADLAPRLNAVEKWQSNADGKITMFGLFCSAIGGVVAWAADLFHRS